MSVSLKQVPDDMLAAMIREGYDTWVAELFGVTRVAIAYHRSRFNIRSRIPYGKAAPYLKEVRKAFLDKWKKRLEGLANGQG